MLLLIIFSCCLGLLAIAPNKPSFWPNWLLVCLVWLGFSASGFILPLWLLVLALVVVQSISLAKLQPALSQGCSLLAAAGLAWYVALGTGDLRLLVLLLSVTALVLFGRSYLPTRVVSQLPPVYLQVVVAGVLCGVGLGWLIQQGLLSHSLKQLPFLGIREIGNETLIRRDFTYGVGWESDSDVLLEKPICALVLHGANAQGSKQPANQSIVVALQNLGLHVLALDHRGYGQSPVPTGQKVSDWDPFLHTQFGYQYLARKGCRQTLIIGHSLGITDAIRLTNEVKDKKSILTLLFGGGLFKEDAAREQYWHQRFHTDRSLPPNTLDFTTWRAIRDQFYLNQVFAKQSQDPSVIAFVDFAFEHQNLQDTRDELWELLGQPKRIRFNSGHYFYSENLPHFVLLNTRILGRLNTLFADLLTQFEDRPIGKVRNGDDS